MNIQWSDRYEFPPSLPDADPDWPLRELAAELQRLKVNVDVKMLGVPDAFPDGGWNIHKEDGVWLVYHSERGRRSRPSIFTSAFDAANFYLWIHVSNPKADNSSVGRLPRTPINK
ncbi:MAG: hypothetical protein IBJ04_01860 [Hydrogenophaga sp.]|uniref:Uncharacterized protein n=1 Tax=Hydrogenophaga crocea TaxID=2716225 RepID=A0A6G8IMU4_9BURK|nr:MULTISPECIES: hypothetical protein [Hydrogenophaga]MBL0943060.1 hypothetical protein [Hydrogenophaga sp.]QIM54532.1 hypothetical protein G9Q37_21360 [Hydrogenophaga crocea]